MVGSKVIVGDSRAMPEVGNNSIGLIVTSPPYWDLKDYGKDEQIGYGQSLHDYLKDLYRVWKECYRVLMPGRRLCINIGDCFTRSVTHGRYKIIPIHAEIISQCEDIGFDYMGAIIWQKQTTMNTTGGAKIMGSYPYPPNGMIRMDYEFILVFRKLGDAVKPSRDVKEQSIISKDDWRENFRSHWRFNGVCQDKHMALFPIELPRRLIKMFSFVGDTVLDPFLGNGTTMTAAMELNRNSIGYEINENFLNNVESGVEIMRRESKIEITKTNYAPRIKNMQPRGD